MRKHFQIQAYSHDGYLRSEKSLDASIDGVMTLQEVIKQLEPFTEVFRVVYLKGDELVPDRDANTWLLENLT